MITRLVAGALIATGLTVVPARFHRPGTWSVRARTQVGSTRSDWSPPVKVRTAR